MTTPASSHAGHAPGPEGRHYEHTTPGGAVGCLRVLQLYPRDMNIYGDWGNTLTLVRRAQWQGYDVTLLSYDPGEELPTKVDLVVGGGGQDSGQERIKEDLLARGATLRAWAQDGVPMLVICGLYQLFGHGFTTASGNRIPGVGVLDVDTVAGPDRLIGNIVTQSADLGRVVGYENHSGLTTLGAQAVPFATVVTGAGNNGQDGTEGARAHHVIGTYLHGSLLPKNPAVADWLLARAAEAAGCGWQPAALAPPTLDGAVLERWTIKAADVAASRPR